MKIKSLYPGIIFITLSVFLMACNQSSDKNQIPVVNICSGDISGYMDDGIYTFKGVPYAKAERFMPPERVDGWQSVLECINYGPIAMQINSWSPDSVMDEKDLFSINIWTSGINDGKKRPVMVWLHGGGFSFGSGSDPITDGKLLAEKGDVVVVSINHRLNILGFLDLSAVDDKYARSANVGMLDIVESLEWVNRNIENFGGDPKNVTIFGESGGGGKVGTLMCMPGAEGLFHKAIIQSGTLVNVMTKDKSQEIGLALLDYMGLSHDEVDQLKDIPYKELVAAGDSALKRTVGLRMPGTSRMFGFGPVPDGTDLLQQPFTPGFADISKNVPLMIGTTFNEMMRTYYAETDLTFEDARQRLKRQYGEQTDLFVELFKKAYPDYSPQDLLSIDTIFRPITIQVADAASTRVAPVYSYMLTWKSPVDDGTRGSFHALDIPLVFNNIELGKHWSGDTKDAIALAEIMSSSWINFAKSGDPNVSEVLPEWHAYTKENGITMIFDDECKIVRNHDRELMNLVLSREQ
ncbi:carboxylesterase/lipase family protein [Natronoflexus pectinivorans]|uniref:Carboxylic ester hydrolase n=1 Tax=Natronoflexus pectinivorans TaxID=682526 RepID=A0A4R2GNP6_9BACT|nr:carboxylesterase family protein [Natronoflexus pectinivorans]TCO10657.1 para-nitrobenzyl esterase [Natronoflexus pectinivorans]